MIKVIDILFNHQGSLLKVPLETVFARAGNGRFEGLGGSQDPPEFDKLMLHFDGFVTASDFIFFNSPELRAALLTPIRRIFSPEFRGYFPNCASGFGKREVADRFVKLLDREWRFLDSLGRTSSSLAFFCVI
jgi:hypothetical protein